MNADTKVLRLTIQQMDTLNGWRGEEEYFCCNTIRIPMALVVQHKQTANRTKQVHSHWASTTNSHISCFDQTRNWPSEDCFNSLSINIITFKHRLPLKYQSQQKRKMFKNQNTKSKEQTVDVFGRVFYIDS